MASGPTMLSDPGPPRRSSSMLERAPATQPRSAGSSNVSLFQEAVTPPWIRESLLALVGLRVEPSVLSRCRILGSKRAPDPSGAGKPGRTDHAVALPFGPSRSGSIVTGMTGGANYEDNEPGWRQDSRHEHSGVEGCSKSNFTAARTCGPRAPSPGSGTRGRLASGPFRILIARS